MKCAPVAQLDRASGYGPEGQGFEFSRACQTVIIRTIHPILKLSAIASDFCYFCDERLITITLLIGLVLKSMQPQTESEQD